jgi:hypothetical protein
MAWECYQLIKMEYFGVGVNCIGESENYDFIVSLPQLALSLAAPTNTTSSVQPLILYAPKYISDILEKERECWRVWLYWLCAALCIMPKQADDVTPYITYIWTRNLG